MTSRLRHSVLSIALLCSLGFAVPEDNKDRKKIFIDDNSKFTTAGNIGLTVTNFGMLGHGFRLCPDQPSCQYPKGSGIEHLWGGGIWIGGFRNGQLGVSTGADLPLSVSSFYNGAEGLEFTNDIPSTVIERSSLPDSRYYSPDAISHQDFIADFTDSNQVIPGTTNPIPKHDYPLNVSIHQETYAWNFPFADNFVILNYMIKNTGTDPIDSVYVGLWADPVVRNTKVTPPTVGSPFYSHAGNGFVDSLRMTYTFDYDGDPGLTDSYIGMKLLGTTPVRQTVYYNSWQFHNTSDPVYFAPRNDNDRYDKMSNPLAPSQVALLRLSGRNELTLLSTGPFSRLNPGDSLNVVFAVICAKKAGTLPASVDNDDQRRNLYVGANWAQRAYNGEDRNGNGIRDSNEVWTSQGQPKRYFLPAPPNAPKVKVVPSSQGVSIYWDASSEQSVDPISNLKDFEGYRVYGTNAGADLTQAQNLLASLVLLAEFDKADDNVGYNTGFGRVRLTQPKTFAGDTTKYWYCFDITNLLNGWQYAYTVVAFDMGDPSINLQSLESGQIKNLTRIVPGTLPTSDKSVAVGVYPNPYYARAYWDGASERERKLYFFNLPANCEIRIYTLAGDIVDDFEHHASSYNASDIKWFSTYSDGSQILAGGEHAWDLITKHDQAIATGLYLFTVKDLDTGEIKRGKFLVIK